MNTESVRLKLRRISKFVVAICAATSIISLVILVAIGIPILTRSSDESAQLMARNYSVEAMSQFRAYINPPLLLLQQISQSQAVESWLNDADDPVLQESALHEISRFSRLWRYGNIRIVARTGLWEYFFEGLNPPYALAPMSQIDIGNPNDEWYFYALRSIAPYSLRILPCPRHNYDLHIMMSQRVYHYGDNVGVVSVTVPFLQLFDIMFHDTENMQAYVIDRTGNVKIDSRQRGLPTVHSIPGLSELPELAATIGTALMHLEGGMFSPGMSPGVVRLDRGHYRFASVLPIVGTDWLIVLMYGSGRMGVTPYIPIILGIIAGFGLIVSVAFFTLKFFTSGTSGVLGIADDSQNLEDTRNAFDTINSAVDALIQTELDEFEPSLMRSLKIVGNSLGVERVFIWEYKLQGGERNFNQIYEWNEGSNEFERQNLKIPRSATLEIQLTRGAFVSSTTHNDVPFLDDAKSYMMAPVFLHGHIWGAIGFANLSSKRISSESDESLIRSIGLLVASNILRAEMIRDITSTSTRIQAVISNYSGIIWSMDANEVITHFNGLMLAERGIQPSYYEGKRLSELPSNWHNFGIVALARKALVDSSLRNNANIMQIDGDVFSIKTAPIFDAIGNIMGVVGSIDDITESYQLQEKLENALVDANAANKAKSEFLSVMSHEIRTPMNSIIGFSELALEDTMTQQTQLYLKKITESSYGLLGIINDILDVSKIESGKIELDHVPFSTDEIFNQCQSLLLPKAIEKEIELSFDVEPSTTLLVGDPVRLRQILVNLLSNAVKFTDSGSVNLSSTIIKETETSQTIFFEVTDTGIGMSDEQISRIFEPFVQADPSVTRRFGGTGLGMSIVKNFLELMGGNLVIDSSLGIGTRFTFELTFETTSDEEIEQNSPRNMKMPYFSGEVLVFEDNKENQMVISEHLARVGLSYIIAENGQVGLDIIEERLNKNQPLFDLILMDINMPVMDGLEATKHIQKMNFGTPIVIMTANVTSDDMTTYKQLKVKDCIGKPFMSYELWACLLKYLKPIDPPDSTIDINDADEKLMKRLAISFVKNNRGIYNVFANCLKQGDNISAHRIAHSLKSSSGQLGRTNLQNLAGELEDLIEDIINEKRSNIPATLLNEFERELDIVMEELSAKIQSETNLVSAGPTKIPAQEKELIEKLESLLFLRNADCLALLEDVRSLPNSAVLVDQIECLNFKAAYKTILELKIEWGL